LGEAADRRFGGAVVRLPGITEQARARAEGDDPPVAPLAHVRAGVAHAVEGALQVHRDDRVPLLLAHVEDHAVAQAAGAGAEGDAAPDAAARAGHDRDAAGEHVCHPWMLHRARASGRGVRSSGSLPPPMLLSDHDRPTALHYRILALTWAGWLFDFYDLILYTFLLEPISRELGLARAAHAVLLGASLGATALGGALFGYLADRHGRRAVLQWSILTYSAGTVLCGR